MPGRKPSCAVRADTPHPRRHAADFSGQASYAVALEELPTPTTESQRLQPVPGAHQVSRLSEADVPPSLQMRPDRAVEDDGGIGQWRSPTAVATNSVADQRTGFQLRVAARRVASRPRPPATVAATVGQFDQRGPRPSREGPGTSLPGPMRPCALWLSSSAGKWRNRRQIVQETAHRLVRGLVVARVKSDPVFFQKTCFSSREAVVSAYES